MRWQDKLAPLSGRPREYLCMKHLITPSANEITKRRMIKQSVKNKSSITGKGLSSYIWKDCIKLKSSAVHSLSPISQPTNKYKNMSLLPPSQTQTFSQHDSPQSTRSSHYGFKRQTAIKTSFPTPNYIMPLLAKVHTMTL